MTYDVAIIGSGPAGLTAGIYSSRAGLKTILIEGSQSGGQLTTTTMVENWPGDVSVMGPELMDRMRTHAQTYGCELLQEMVTSVSFDEKPFRLTTESEKIIQTQSVIIATGAHHKKLGCPGEQEFFNRGVSTCATCDGPFFKNKDVVIVGGGNTAVTEAEHLSRICSSVTIIHILDELTATDPIKFKILNHPKVRLVYSSTVTEIRGNEQGVTEVLVENQKDKSHHTIPTSAVFVAIGFNPATSLFTGKLEMDSFGYLKLRDNTKTSVPGIFAAGDVADYRYRQAITAAGMGCMAALDAQAYLGQHETT